MPPVVSFMIFVFYVYESRVPESKDDVLKGLSPRTVKTVSAISGHLDLPP
jgi:hypothetical protein